MDHNQVSDAEIAALGLVRIHQPQPDMIGGVAGELRRIEVHSVRPARWVGPDGNVLFNLVVEITQTFRPTDLPGARFRGGCTLLIDLATADIRCMMRKRVKNPDRIAAQMSFGADEGGLRGNYFANDESGPREPFARMHDVHG